VISYPPEALRDDAAAGGIVTLRVLLAEDMHLIRGALVALLRTEPDIEVVAEVDNGEAVLPAVLAHRPDIAVLDVVLPGMDGLAAAEVLGREVPSCRVLLMTSVDQPGVLRQVMHLQVPGFLAKDAPPQELADAIRRVCAGGRVIDPRLTLATRDMRDSPLTLRETDVLRLTSHGAGAMEVAARLHLSVGTVRNYLTAILTKLNARSKVDAVRIAEQAGWL
jgi:two-component system, NarL family, response regulator DesR